METVGVSVTRLKESFDVNFYPDWQLSRGVFFDKKNFGETKSSAAIRAARYLMIFRRTGSMGVKLKTLSMIFR